MRDIYKVRKAMLEVVEELGLRDMIRNGTERTLTSACYTAPEAQGEIWNRFCLDLAYMLPEEEGRKYSWFPRFVGILNGAEDKERGWR